MKNINKLAALISFLLLPAASFAQGWSGMEACKQSAVASCNAYEGGTCQKNWETTDNNTSYYSSVTENLRCGCTGGTFFLGGCSVLSYYPSSSPPPPRDPPRNPKCVGGSIVDIDARTLGEKIPISGVNFTLNYTSLRAQSRLKNYKFIRHTYDGSSSATFSVTSHINNVLVDTQTINNDINHWYEYVWDGLDSTNNPTLASTNFVISILPSGTVHPYGRILSIGGLKAKLLGFGGWMPSNYHFYDVAAQMLHFGDGRHLKVIAQDLVSGGFQVPDVDSGKVYEFDSTGRHVYTKTFRIGTVVETFHYTSYAGKPLLTSISEPFNRTTTFNRDSNGNLLSITSPDGVVTSVSLSNGLLTAVTSPMNHTYLLTYKLGTDLLETFEKPQAQVNSFSYDNEGNLISDAHSGGYAFTLMNTNATTDSTTTHLTSMNRSTTIYTSNTRNGSAGSYSRTVVLPSGATHTHSENGSSSSSRRDGINVSQSLSYDPRFGLLNTFVSNYAIGTRNTSVAIIRNPSIPFPYTPPDPFDYLTLTERFTTGGFYTYSTFELAAKTITTTSPLGRTRLQTLDNYERLISDEWATDTPTTFSYTNEKLTAVQQGGRSTNLTYSNSSGLLASITNSLNQTTTLGYDSDRRLRYVTHPDSRVLEYDYDGNGNLIRIKPPGRSDHLLNLNAHEMLGQYQPPAIVPLVVNTGYTYNNDKQLTLITRPDAQTIAFNYGATSSTLQSVVTPTGTYTYTYSAYDERTQSGTTPYGINNFLLYNYGLLGADYVTDNSTNTSYSYDPNYNSELQLTSDIVNPTSGSPSTIIYQYDNDELINKAGDVMINRDPVTARISGTGIGSMTDARTYSSYGELDGYSASYGSTVLYGYTIARDTLGRIDTIAETFQGTTDTFDYDYDLSGRLSVVTKNGVGYSAYNYDSNSNRTSGNVGGSPFAATIDAHDRLTGYNTFTFAYTNAGELLSKTNTLTAQTTHYTYDVLGNLRSVALPSGPTITYEPDAFGRRSIRKKNGTVQSRYLFKDDIHVIAEMNSNGTLKKRFIYGTHEIVPDYMIIGGIDYRIVADPRGSVRLVVKVSDGSIAQRLDYDEYGRVLNDTNPGFQPFGYAGGLYDHETGLVRFGARDYDSETGRWTSKDPILFAGSDTNLYGYVLQDPINFIDPAGKFAVSPYVAIPIIAGGIYCIIYPQSCNKRVDDISDYFKCLGKPNCIPTRAYPPDMPPNRNPNPTLPPITPWSPSSFRTCGTNNRDDTLSTAYKSFEIELKT